MARNTNRQGAGFELDVMHYLDGCECETTFERPRHIGWSGFGYDSARSSGSRGKVDVFCVGQARQLKTPMGPLKITGKLLFVQCKISRPLLSPADRRSLIDLAARAGAYPLVAWRAKDETTGRIRPHFRRLTGLGPKDWLPWEPTKEET